MFKTQMSTVAALIILPGFNGDRDQTLSLSSVSMPQIAGISREVGTPQQLFSNLRDKLQKAHSMTATITSIFDGKPSRRGVLTVLRENNQVLVSYSKDKVQTGNSGKPQQKDSEKPEIQWIDDGDSRWMIPKEGKALRDFLSDPNYKGWNRDYMSQALGTSPLDLFDPKYQELSNNFVVDNGASGWTNQPKSWLEGSYCVVLNRKDDGELVARVNSVSLYFDKSGQLMGYMTGFPSDGPNSVDGVFYNRSLVTGLTFDQHIDRKVFTPKN